MLIDTLTGGYTCTCITKLITDCLLLIVNLSLPFCCHCVCVYTKGKRRADCAVEETDG